VTNSPLHLSAQLAKQDPLQFFLPVSLGNLNHIFQLLTPQDKEFETTDMISVARNYCQITDLAQALH
jgi:hypothetical protein